MTLARTLRPQRSRLSTSEHETSDDEPDAYANEPMADEEWLAQYEEERKTEEELEKKLENRLCGAEEIKEWLVGIVLCC